MATVNTRKVNNLIHLPNEFREMVTREEINPTVLLQLYINHIFLYPRFSKMNERAQLAEARKILEGMVGYENSSHTKTGISLWDICTKHIEVLISLSKQKNYSLNQKMRKSKKALKDWEMEVVPLINYPAEIILENGGKLNISFNYFLMCLCFDISPGDDLVKFMLLTCKNDETSKKEEVLLNP